MSVCIAAVADTRKAIVFAGDRMVSFVAFSADNTMTKTQDLVPGRWWCAFAGNDISHVDPVISNTQEDLRSTPKPSLKMVASSVLRHYHDERIALATDRLLSIYGLSMQKFLADGVSFFGDQGAAVMRERIEQVSLDCSLLIYGFDGKDQAHIFSVEPPGTAQHFDRLGYWAIGSGADAALSRLAIREQKHDLPITQTLYNVCEGKRAAHTAVGVGKRTQAWILRPNSFQTIKPEAGRKVIEICGRAINPKVNPSTLQFIESNLLPAQDIAPVTESAE